MVADAAAPGMLSDLRALLVANKVDERIIVKLEEKKCLKISNFANWLDEAKEAKTEILDLVDALKDDRAELTNIKQAWKEAVAANTFEINNPKSLAKEPEDPEAPLDDKTFKDVKATFRAYYKWPDFDNRRIGHDGLYGRFKCEFDRRQPNVYPVFMAKSLAEAKVLKKKERYDIGNNVELRTNVDIEAYVKPTLPRWFERLEIIGNTWAVCGCFDVMHEGGTYPRTSTSSRPSPWKCATSTTSTSCTPT